MTINPGSVPAYYRGWPGGSAWSTPPRIDLLAELTAERDRLNVLIADLAAQAITPTPAPPANN